MDLKNWDWSKPIVKAVVGQDRKIFYVHPDALSCKSPVWKSRLEGSWKGDKHDIDWTEFDVETIKYVLSFLYTGSYKPVNNSRGRDVQGAIDPQPPLGDGPGATKDGVTHPNAEDHQEYKENTTRDKGLESPVCIFGELLVTHSKVYTFAAQFLCSELKQLALQGLATVVKVANTKALDLLPGLLEAIRLIYEKTQEQTSGPEPARALLMQFLVQHLEHLDNAVDLVVLESQEVVKDLIQETLRRATIAEKESARKSKRIQELKNRRCMRCGTYACGSCACGSYQCEPY